MRPLSQVPMFSMNDYISLLMTHGYPIIDDLNLHIKTTGSKHLFNDIMLKNTTVIYDDISQ